MGLIFNKMINKIKRLKIVVYFFRLISPGYSYCTKCGLPWNWCEEKSVKIDDNSGTFSTCQYCWDHSNLEELKEYYIQTYHIQERCGSYHQLDHTLEHLLDCVERDYGMDIKTKRNLKIQKIKFKINSYDKN